MLIKIHRAYRNVVAICDSEILGKHFEEGKNQLNVKESFYKGEEVDEEQLLERMIDFAREDSTFNIVGHKSVNCALKAGIITKEGVKKVQGIPYTLVLV